MKVSRSCMRFLRAFVLEDAATLAAGIAGAGAEGVVFCKVDAKAALASATPVVGVWSMFLVAAAMRCLRARDAQ